MRINDTESYKKDIDIALRGISALDGLSGRKIMITGAGGMLGSFIVDSLIRLNDTADMGIMVYALGRDPERLKKRFGERKDLFFIRYDLNEAFDEDIRTDYVIHAAGNSDPASFNRDPVGTMTGNVGGTHLLLDYARDHGCKRFLYVSSGEIYGQGGPDTDSYEESYSGYVDPTSVRSCYPVSKRAAENLCVSYCSEYDLDTVIVRPCHIYGPGFKKTDSHAYVQFLQDALNGRDIVMKSAGSQVRSYIYVADCASAIMSVLLLGEKGQAYNVSNPDSVVTVSGLAKEIAGSAGVDVVFSEPDAKDIRDRSPISRQVLDPGKLVKLGWKPSFPISDGVGHTVTILREMNETTQRI